MTCKFLANDRILCMWLSSKKWNELSLETKCMRILIINIAVKSRCDGNNATPHGNILLPLWSQNFIWCEFTLKVSLWLQFFESATKWAVHLIAYDRLFWPKTFHCDPNFVKLIHNRPEMTARISHSPSDIFINPWFLPFSSWVHILDLIFLRVRIL